MFKFPTGTNKKSIIVIIVIKSRGHSHIVLILPSTHSEYNVTSLETSDNQKAAIRRKPGIKTVTLDENTVQQPHHRPLT